VWFRVNNLSDFSNKLLAVLAATIFASFSITAVAAVSIKATAETSLPISNPFSHMSDYDGNFKTSTNRDFNSIRWMNMNGGVLQVVGECGHAVFDTSAAGGGDGFGGTRGSDANKNLKDFIMSFDFLLSATAPGAGQVGALFRLDNNESNGYALILDIANGGMRYRLFTGASLTSPGKQLVASPALPPAINANKFYTFRVSVVGPRFTATVLDGTNTLSSWSCMDNLYARPGQVGLRMYSYTGVTEQIANFSLDPPSSP
jgi:hypothetical protein